MGKVPVMKLWLDDLRPAPADWEWVKTFEEAVGLMNWADITDASLDHDLGYGKLPEDTPGETYNGVFIPDARFDINLKSGYDFVRWMAEFNIWPSESLAVHSANPSGAERMYGTIERYGPYDKRERVAWTHSPCGGFRYRKSGE